MAATTTFRSLIEQLAEASDMSPRPTQMDVLDVGLADTKSCSYTVLGDAIGQQATDLKHIRICELRRVMRHAASEVAGVEVRRPMFGATSLRGAVSVVLAFGARPQMIGVAASAVVAAMKDARGLLRDWAIRQDVRDTMGGGVLAAIGRLAIPVRRHSPEPRPAFVGRSLLDTLQIELGRSPFVRGDTSASHTSMIGAWHG